MKKSCKIWTQNEIDFLLKNYKTKTSKEIAILLNRTIKSIEYKEIKLRFKKRNCHKWTEQEEQFLKDYYLILNNRELSKILNRSIRSISDKIHKLNLKRPKIKRSQIGICEICNKSFKYFPSNSKGKCCSKECSNIWAKKNAYWKDKHRDEETKNKLSKAHSNKILSENHKRKISENALINPNYGMKNKKHTEETKKKQSIKAIESGKHCGEKNGMYGKKQKEESKLKMRLKAIERFKDGMPQEIKEKIKEITNLPKAKEQARQRRLYQVFPVKDSLPERILQKGLRDRGIVFETQKPIESVFSIPDIFIKPNIIVYADGDFFHGYDWDNLRQKLEKNNNIAWIKTIRNNIKKDPEITEQLISEGFIVLRFWEHEIKKNTEECIDKILYMKSLV